jgi:tetratricopeptide (TPR) repeat protein
VCAAVIVAAAPIACAPTQIADEVKFGVWASQQGLWDEAIFRWKKAVAENPRSVAALNNLAVAYEKKGLFDEALKSYAAALAIEPENSYVKSNYKNCQENIQGPKTGEPAKTDEKKK